MSAMDHKPELLILAAGMGSRYGGLKQLDGIGPNGETIMDYSIYDAIRAGFGKIVFVIKEEHLDLFASKIVSKFSSQVDIGYAIQHIQALPTGYAAPGSRVKPWGTGHAVFCASGVITRPFAVINADDFYGRAAFSKMAESLADMDPWAGEFFLLGYRLANTLSEHGSVSRGLCQSRRGYLTAIKEMTTVRLTRSGIVCRENGGKIPLDPDALVSMNFWGFSPLFFKIVEDGFRSFLDQHLDSPDVEYFITQPVDDAAPQH